jgi:fatty-acyl-CoA synthase
MPLFHTAGNVLGVLGAVSAGVEQVLVPFRPDTVRAAAAETDAEVLGAAPTMLHAIVRDTAPEPAALSSLRVIYTGGATLEPTFIRQVENTLGARVSVGFGMTETCGCISMTRPSDDDHVRFETSGRLIPATEISVVDSITGIRLPAGQEGEICVRGDRVTPGYLDAEGKLTAATDGQGWLHTGDVGTIESGGSLIVTGRMKDMIKSGGENVSPAEVEACLAGHPTVSQVAVIGVPSEQWGELVTAFVQLRPGATTTVAELDDYCRKLLAPHKRPRRWNIADVLPVTASGKLRKQSLRDMVRSGQAELLAVNRVVPR